MLSGCSRPSRQESASYDKLADVAPASAEAVVRFCGDCHVPPDPLTYPKGHWPQEVQRGFDFYSKSGRKDLRPPSQDSILKYYLSLAPDELQIPGPIEDLSSSPIRFRRESIMSAAGKIEPAVSHLLAADDGLYVTDMLSGQVCRIRWDRASGQAEQQLCAQVKQATHVERVDLFGDGEAGLLVADIGNMTPQDHQLGGVYYFPAGFEQANPEPGSSRMELLTDVGRVADVKAGDFNGDGLLDVIVAVFGYHESGKLELLLRDPDSEEVRFTTTTVDPRHGASHVWIHDIDSDADLDLIVLHSQEFESVTAYLNDGQAHFVPKILYNGPVPDFGCSSIEIADLDADGDMDIVLTNGDSMDSNLAKPHHGVRWLENRSENIEAAGAPADKPARLLFQEHLIAPMVGAYGSAIADLDGDGDLDIAACGMIWDDSEINTLIWFEQQPDHSFLRHCLDLSLDQHPCIELGDFDNDGDVDIAVGEFDQFIPLETWISVWWNEGPAETGLTRQESAHRTSKS